MSIALQCVALAACLFYGCTSEAVRDLPRPRPVSGTLALSGFLAAAHENSPGATQHTSLLVPGLDYDGMQDNDIRGFPNGRWVHGWNQVGQRHVRLGRGLATSRFGEMEIMRALQRWDDIPLPANAIVTQVSLEIMVESGIENPADVMLYEVHRDWNPGSGGTQRDNTSPPAPGEVWWPDAAHGEVEWGLPGASFASDNPGIGDVSPLALATAHYVPGTSRLAFSSGALTGYVQRRVASSKPLLFLLKLSDSDEDLVGDELALYSAEEGDSLCVGRRPRLKVEWNVPTEVVGWKQGVLLEHGRSVELPKLPTKGANHWAASFHPRLGYERPEMEVRGGSSSSSSEWRSAAIPFEVDWDWIQARLVAARNPVPLGRAFESEFVDTWVPDAKPEDQTVNWHFTDPLGREIDLRGSYEGPYRWRVAFHPKVLGRWSYYVDHDLNWPPYRSEQVVFDVLADDITIVLDHLEDLAERIEASNLTTRRAKFETFGDEFLRLERAGIQLLTPEIFRSERGAQFSSRVDQIRGELGEGLPEQPTAYNRKIRRSIKRDIARELYRVLGFRLDKH
ncbi:MAG: DUF5060 domain-containing protein [Myxococcales bacterium]|nr:DUF5060 domain-containing protein [Myxococcales bacterium]